MAAEGRFVYSERAPQGLRGRRAGRATRAVRRIFAVPYIRLHLRSVARVRVTVGILGFVNTHACMCVARWTLIVLVHVWPTVISRAFVSMRLVACDVLAV